MSEPVLIVQPEPNASDSSERPAMAGPPTAAHGTGGRFVYASGSQPLSGYTIRRGLGHGGFGEVYYATSDAGKEVALKLIRRNLEVELRGIRHCLNLKHPNLLAIFDIREDGRDDNWVVMEYVTGRNLEETIAAHPVGMPPEEALAWMHGIGAGVACLHDHGIVHRDLKPGNIFCDQGIVKVGDYGLSKFISCSRRSGQTESVGTVHYMAPEVANGRYGKEIDVYALGVILYEMLTGRVPFEGESVGEVLMKHLTAKPDVSLLIEPYRSVVARALEKDPARRFSSVGEMLAALPKPANPQISAGAWPTPRSAGVPPTQPGQAPHASPSPPLPELLLVEEGPEVTRMASVEPAREEPIFAAVRRGCRRARRRWDESDMNRPMRALVLIGVAWVAMHTWPLWMPLLTTLMGLYVFYWIVRQFVLWLDPQAEQVTTSWPSSPARAAGAAPAAAPPGPRTASPAALAPGPPAIVRAEARRAQRRHRPAEIYVPKPMRERMAELLGSLVLSSLVAATMCLVLAIVGDYRGSPPNLEQAALMVVMSIAGAWSVLAATKFWEGREGDAMVRRFILMVVGLGLGVLAFATSSYLSPASGLPIPLPFDGVNGIHRLGTPRSFYLEDRPLVPAYMACFGTLFVLLRWWRQADPMRSTRLSPWATLVSVGMAWLVAILWQFSQPWLMMTACAISVAVQLSSPWRAPQQRRPPDLGS